MPAESTERSYPHEWLRPDWPVPAHVQALCTTRAGGVSVAPFDSLNLGDHVHDVPEAVRANREVLQRALRSAGRKAARPVFLRQVHGVAVLPLADDTPDGTEADACVAQGPGVACTIMVADCLPVLLTDRQGSRVAAAHAGWRGLAGVSGYGVLESVVESMGQVAPMGKAHVAIKKEASTRPDDLLAWLGPCIGPSVFEVGGEVREAFCTHDARAARCFQSHGAGKFLADLAGLARWRLQALGITAIYGNDSSPSWCTVSQPSRFFSHRRDTVALGGCGRFAACIWLDECPG